MSTRIILDNKYIVGEGDNSWAISDEKGIVLGDVRVIGGLLMQAYRIKTRRFGKQKVSWVPVGDLKGSKDLTLWVSRL